MISAPKRAENEEGELVYKDGFPEIEQLLKGRNFSRYVMDVGVGAFISSLIAGAASPFVCTIHMSLWIKC